MLPFPPPTLAVDYGRSRIGLAHSMGSLAEPVKVILHDEQAVMMISRLVRELGCAQILIGVSEGDMAAESKAFGQKLANALHLPVIFTDETLSSHQATQHLREKGRTVPGVRPVIDHLAAAEFLQEWLDTHAQAEA